MHDVSGIDVANMDGSQTELSAAQNRADDPLDELGKANRILRVRMAAREASNQQSCTSMHIKFRLR